MSFLEISQLSVFYGKAQALHEVSVSVKKGEIIAIVGANGAGKSSLLDSILGLNHSIGHISLESRSLLGMTSSEIVNLGVGYATERFNLFPYMSVRDNLLVGSYTSRGDIEKNLEVVHKLFPTLEDRKNQETSTLSGGERQMVSLGRSLMINPKLLLVDEPTIGLSPKICQMIAVVLKRLANEFGTTIVIAEQNANFAISLAERLYVLETGRIKMQGTAKELNNDPALASAYFGH